MLPYSVELPTDLLALLLAGARATAPREFVGLLAGQAGDAASSVLVVQALFELPNLAADDDTYEVPAAAFAAAEARARGDGHTFLGFVHSHPRGAPEPSRRDVSAWWPHCVQLIVGSDTHDTPIAALRAYWRDATTLHELPLRLLAVDAPTSFAVTGAR